jgi:hypothetical protein
MSRVVREREMMVRRKSLKIYSLALSLNELALVITTTRLSFPSSPC